MPTNYDKLRTLLRELFQMDQADLDFGLYRIMNAKRGEIERFLEHDLLPQVKSELARHTTLDSGAKQAELAAAIEGAQKLGVNPDAVPKVQELRAQLQQGGDLDSLENEVFSHLYNFFRRYYHQGDFLSLRRYKEGVYAIPYEGEEVKLYWANHDQYYIKSTEYLRNYTFKLRNNRRVHFKVVEADTEADNNKSQGGKERRFILAGTAPVAVENGELFIRFHYQADARKQTELNVSSVATVLGNPALTDWLAELGDLRPTEKKPDRTLLAKHLDDFTARFTFDYFIHKDLGGFLRRELDFFIKNEVMHLDDVEDEAAPKVELYLSKIKALRKIAHKFIAFLEQLENFQKRLWLKKKFVVETNYCVTLDRVPEALYAEIAANEAQRAEWVKLFAIDEIEASPPASAPAQGELIATIAPQPTPGYTVPLTVEFLKANPFLVLDTKFFSAEFTVKLLSDNKVLGGSPTLDEATGGLLVNGENLQALGLLLARFRDGVKCIYIDPPYNNDKDDFAYKDSYQHSSWLSMTWDRLAACNPLLRNDGVFWGSIDDREAGSFRWALEQHFGREHFVSDIAVVNNFKGRQDRDHIATAHEHLLICQRPEFESFGFPLTQAQVSDYDLTDTDGLAYQLRDLRKRGGADTRAKRPNLFFPLYWNQETRVMSVTRQSAADVEIVPMKSDGTEGCWRWSKKAVASQLEIIEGTQVRETGRWNASYRVYLENDGETRTSKPKSIWLGSQYSSDRGIKELRSFFPDVDFNGPKAPALIRDILLHSTCDDAVVLDFFGGSGTTGQATLLANAVDSGERKFILVESGTQFDGILKPRIEKCAYSTGWSDGKPVSREGSSHLFKYIRLESYEDCLNNLELKRTPAQDDLLAEAKDFREDYTLRYMLDVETRGSASLLNVQQFTDPFNYQLKVSTGTVGETKAVKVDLVETFNWLVGLKVHSMSVEPVGATAYARVKGKTPDGDKLPSVLVVEGVNPQSEKVIVLWRNVVEMDNDLLDEWFRRKLQSPRTGDFDLIYVNGDNHLENLRRPDQTWKVRSIEEDFHRLMWECQDV